MHKEELSAYISISIICTFKLVFSPEKSASQLDRISSLITSLNCENDEC